ncbi:small integral membrane protein 28-like [Pygocentrus nattereri]|uniref:small integral membrane protein 28-like n=1 Tax=Pygocentrus nattereri TaxID=42514 RepID=UPI001890E8C3|nr:small integral membrane protein 28-like [Pygocentrus nattereri]XP_037399743.1 small integral membrane protein 28-like [Pygocentrus nattereri]
MRKVLESSWMKFGPAGRGSYDWMTGSPSPPPTEKQPQGYHWNELSTEEDVKSEVILYVVLPLASLLIFGLVGFLVYRKCSRSKLTLANIIALDLQDAESSAEFLSSLTANGERLNSTSSDVSDGVFLMVYLPPPYEETLTKITRAASLSSGKDVESIKMEDLEAKLCPELKSSGRYV